MNGMALLAGGLAAAAALLWSPPPRALPHAATGPGGDAETDALPPGLALEMLAAAVSQGASIPRALEAMGRAWSGETGEVLCGVATSLHRGADWHNAWALACAHPRCGGVMGMLSDTLEPAHRHGTSPLPRIEAAVDQIDKTERRLIEERAAKLGVRMLVPTGACFLPAFVLIGVLPVIASFGAGAFGSGALG
ncbi:type II secretion system protein, pilus assembly [Bifidobacterium sp. DSM 109958]|uniref:Type II secretion system protein, pilus assembly n=1 Tax=Bifidobacterium moraviense TaxID=2675323 RepID=A0A7Y0F1Z4_9BIFI|nr:type II secretion system F family protein [Bifidobacterium sp. DSM 109958]NMN00575.1 type II secretion system protein, pilus assembly [Bifidobacterium sp. DSM 109958]